MNAVDGSSEGEEGDSVEEEDDKEKLKGTDKAGSKRKKTAGSKVQHTAPRPTPLPSPQCDPQCTRRRLEGISWSQASGLVDTALTLFYIFILFISFVILLEYCFCHTS